MLTIAPEDQTTAPKEETIYRAVSKTGISLGVRVERSVIFTGDQTRGDDPLDGLVTAAKRTGIQLREIKFEQLTDALSFLFEGLPIMVACPDGSLTVIDAGTGKKFEATHFQKSGFEPQVFTHRKLRRFLMQQHELRSFVAKKELECDALQSSAGDHTHSDAHHDHKSPLRRFISLLAMERRDISTVILFAFVSGILTLATPLAVESLVNVVSWGVYLQPLLVLGMILLVSLGLAGILRILQKVAVEMIQRRQFVRIVGDLAHRFPRANQAALEGRYPREFANRIFDIMTIQKATAVLLLDGVSIVLTTFLGMVLLAFYHPFLLGFDIVLLISMISITWILGRGGIRTAVDESKTKYETIHWLQDVLATPSAFKIGGGEALAIDRANELTSAYIEARRKQFRVVLRQSAFAIMLQVFASTAVLALGGWLVIQGQLTLGQLVASELVVTVVVGAFAKAGKSLEKFFDLMAGVDKVGYLIDIPVDPRPEVIQVPNWPISVAWTDIKIERASSTTFIQELQVDPGASIAVIGDDMDGKSDFAKCLVGLLLPKEGSVRIGDLDPLTIAGAASNRIVGYAGQNDIFHGTIRENVDLGREGIGQARVREALETTELSEVVLRLNGGLQTQLQTGGHPLTSEQVSRLMVARAIVTRPKLLVLDRTLDRIAPNALDAICDVLTAPDASWTLIVVTDRVEIATRFEKQIYVRQSEHTTRKGDKR